MKKYRHYKAWAITPDSEYKGLSPADLDWLHNFDANEVGQENRATQTAEERTAGDRKNYLQRTDALNYVSDIKPPKKARRTKRDSAAVEALPEGLLDRTSTLVALLDNDRRHKRIARRNELDKKIKRTKFTP